MFSLCVCTYLQETEEDIDNGIESYSNFDLFILSYQNTYYSDSSVSSLRVLRQGEIPSRFASPLFHWRKDGISFPSFLFIASEIRNPFCCSFPIAVLLLIPWDSNVSHFNGKEIVFLLHWHRYFQGDLWNYYCYKRKAILDYWNRRRNFWQRARILKKHLASTRHDRMTKRPSQGAQESNTHRQSIMWHYAITSGRRIIGVSLWRS